MIASLTTNNDITVVAEFLHKPQALRTSFDIVQVEALELIVDFLLLIERRPLFARVTLVPGPLVLGACFEGTNIALHY